MAYLGVQSVIIFLTSREQQIEFLNGRPRLLEYYRYRREWQSQNHKPTMFERPREFICGDK
jgi:hypothetical protein